MGNRWYRGRRREFGEVGREESIQKDGEEYMQLTPRESFIIRERNKFPGIAGTEIEIIEVTD